MPKWPNSRPGVKPRVWKALALALQGRHSGCTALTGLISRVLFPGLAPWALLRRAFGAPDYPGSKKYAALGGTPALPANRRLRLSIATISTLKMHASLGVVSAPCLSIVNRQLSIVNAPIFPSRRRGICKG